MASHCTLVPEEAKPGNVPRRGPRRAVVLELSLEQAPSGIGSQDSEEPACPTPWTVSLWSPLASLPWGVGLGLQQLGNEGRMPKSVGQALNEVGSVLSPSSALDHPAPPWGPLHTQSHLPPASGSPHGSSSGDPSL